MQVIGLPVRTPQFQEQFVESVQKTPRGRLLERIEEPIENTPIENILPAVPASETWRVEPANIAPAQSVITSDDPAMFHR